MRSVIQSEKECFVCKTTKNLHVHHLLHGTANRKKADKHGLWIYLCMDHHTGNNGVHTHHDFDLKMKRLAQTYYEQNIGTREDFIRDYGRSYL